ncbi:hypothetical protein DAKH74_025840 [Maudiozyma humilis]|uniref:Cell division control protein 50 n=1 Tax=Maudiozyma humilis TaxID=51915 RepID=A0AAV5RX26_MAUHU|nr:hypothetical protein DAKH74_025840 [Kazachstania humilis]
MAMWWKGLRWNRPATRRPLNTGFRQQRLRAWQPNLSPQNTLPTLLVLVALFVPIGIGLLVSALNVQDLTIRYDQCALYASTDAYSTVPSKFTSAHFKEKLLLQPRWRLVENSKDDSQSCILDFEIPNEVASPIYIYYKLTNFYQNHRVYIESYDLDQLKGSAISADSLDKHCDPLRKDNNTGKAIYPCGLVANSMFNDTFEPQLRGADSSTADFQLTNDGTAWSTDKHRYHKTQYTAAEIVPPPNWAKRFPQGYTDTNIPDIQTWPEFQVWMRTAALPTFYKRILQNESASLPRGHYSMTIGLNFPVDSFNGTKTFVLTTNSIMGAKNIWLGIVYLIIAGVSIGFAVVFLFSIIFQSQATLENHQYLANVRDETPPGMYEDGETTRARARSITQHIREPEPARAGPSFPVREIL